MATVLLTRDQRKALEDFSIGYFFENLGAAGSDPVTSRQVEDTVPGIIPGTVSGREKDVWSYL